MLWTAPPLIIWIYLIELVEQLSGDNTVDRTTGPGSGPSLVRTTAAFVDALGLKRYIIYVFDYGAPLAGNWHWTYPDQVTGIVSQNGNAYLEGLGEKAWAPLRAYWADP